MLQESSVQLQGIGSTRFVLAVDNNNELGHDVSKGANFFNLTIKNCIFSYKIERINLFFGGNAHLP